ncbi:DgyrCDS5211 [Dimorphilus gyrociliatus]|uniref:DgyrCDS5211 n=1 Tax=Dimorphilus gyrociliatus TaxID=2664684 RepID=A0A7I8VJA7_9ANNE|nr:DgyrCDS5211 [Dimorphilus gyrociliatus]
MSLKLAPIIRLFTIRLSSTASSKSAAGEPAQSVKTANAAQKTKTESAKQTSSYQPKREPHGLYSYYDLDSACDPHRQEQPASLRK